MKFIAIFLSVILLIAVIFLLFMKEKPAREDMNKIPKQTNHKTDSNITDPNTRRSLRLSDINLSEQLTKEQVISNWGPPDAIVGSGVEYLCYTLEDGCQLGLRFASKKPHQLLDAFLTDSSKKESKVLFDVTNKTKPR